MILHILSDASYISEPETQIRAGGFLFLGPKSNILVQAMPPENGPVHVEWSIMRNFIASDMETKLGGLFENCQKATSTQTDLSETGH